MGEVADLLGPLDLSPTQYNVLRILRAAGGEGLPCGQISRRMLTREPDITRLLDRLEARQLIHRRRDARDRRIVLGHITEEGIELLKWLDRPISDLHRRQLGGLGRRRLKQLAGLLEIVRKRT